MTVPDYSSDTTAQLVFQAPQSSPTWVNINSQNADGTPESNFKEETHTVKVRNIRTADKKFGIDITGFDVQHVPSKFASEDWRNFFDEERIKNEYYPEIITAVKNATGAREVFIFDHTIRRRNPGVADDDPTRRQPVSRVHVDQTPKAVRQRVHRHLGDRADELLKGRVQLINVWRPIENPASDYPLALCDYNSLKPHNLSPTELIYPDPTPNGETYNVLFDEAQEYWYCKDQTPDEITFIKCFDSANVAKLTPHTAFNDPNTRKGSPLRQSIEVRCLVFH